MLSIQAPAKINLVLEVLGNRSDGYHEICSILHTINLCDSLSFELAEGISLECSEPSLGAEDNLVLRAARLLKEVTWCTKGVRIKLQKRIPWGVGLGGGSSDAAATLRAINKLWGLGLSVSDLVRLATQLGSDVAFFIYGDTALAEGRGEKVTPLPAPTPIRLVLLVPSLPKLPQKTQQLYTRLSDRDFTTGQFVRNALKYLSQGKRIKPSLLFNAFAKVVFDAFPGLEDYWESFKQAGAANIGLAGSGPALFTLADSEMKAKELHLRLNSQGLKSYLVSSFNGKLTQQ